MKLHQFAETLASSEPAPGGGSTAALQAALGLGLAHMVAGLTLGREKYAAFFESAQAVQKAAAPVQARLEALVDEDTEAYNGVTAVLAMPKTTEAEKAARAAAMQQALQACTKTPYQTMQCCEKGLALCQKLAAGYNTNCASDLGVAVLSLKAAVQGAWLNVCSNLSGIKDEAFCTEYRTGGQQLLARALPLADALYEGVVAQVCW